MSTPPLPRFPLLAALMCCGASLAAAAPQEVLQLESGLDLGYQLRRASEQVHGSIRVDAGPAYEPAHQVGLTRVLVDALTAGGSTARPRSEIDAWLRERGAFLEVKLAGDQLAIDFRCAPEDLDAALEIVRDLLIAPDYRPRAVASAKNRVLSRLGRTPPTTVANRALVELLAGDAATDLRLPHKSDVTQLTAGDLADFHRTHVTADRTVIALHGPLQDGLPELVEAAFAELPPGAPPTSPEATGEEAGAVPAVPFTLGATTVLLDMPAADHVEVRVGLARADAATMEPAPAETAALLLLARYHTPAATAYGRPAVAAELFAAVDLDYGPDGVLSGALGVPPELAQVAGLALARAVSPPADESFEPKRLEEARGGLLAVLDPADDGARLLARMQRARAGGGEEQHAALIAAVRALDGPALLEAARANAAQSELVTVYVGPAAAVAETLAGVEQLALRSGLRQPRGDRAALALRARMLTSLGGGERWAELASIGVNGVAELPQLDEPVPVKIVRDLRTGTLVISQVVFGQEALTISTDDASWIRQAESVSMLDAERHAALRFAEERQFFRLVRELARGRELRLSAEGQRLDLWRGAERLAWFQLGEDGRPVALGHDGDIAASGGSDGPAPGGQTVRTELAQWVERDGLVLPGYMHQEAKGSTHRWTEFQAGVVIDPELLVRPGG